MMALLFPILVAVIYAVMEASTALVISEQLDQSARQAARNIAVAYISNPGLATSNANALKYGCQPVLKPIGAAGGTYVTDLSQFGGVGGAGTNITFTNLANMNVPGSTSPPTVTVTCTYISNATTGLPKFPQWDVLNLSKVPGFKLMSTAVYQIE